MLTQAQKGRAFRAFHEHDRAFHHSESVNHGQTPPISPRPSTFEADYISAGSLNLAFISGASKPIAWKILPPLATTWSSVAATLSNSAER